MFCRDARLFEPLQVIIVGELRYLSVTLAKLLYSECGEREEGGGGGGGTRVCRSTHSKGRPTAFIKFMQPYFNSYILIT